MQIFFLAKNKTCYACDFKNLIKLKMLEKTTAISFSLMRVDARGEHCL